MGVTAQGYFLDKGGEPLQRREYTLDDPGPGEAIVEVAACGLCHTDLGYADGSVPTKHPLPLVLGHEVVGKVVAVGKAFSHLTGRDVIVPAVLPCGECEYCRAGRGNACPHQKMPGNDVNGGFSTHLLVPAKPLVALKDIPAGFDTKTLCVVADAVSTAYQAVRRSGLAAGDVAFVVGAGGVGGFTIQVAKALGARVAALDVSEARLAMMTRYGADKTFHVANRPNKEIKKDAHGWAKQLGVSSLRYKIFECSGSPAGQSLAFDLLARCATLLQVGYTPKAVEVRLSNLMAFDATVHGSWGCPPEAYGEVLRLIYDGKVVIAPFAAHAPMSRLNQLLDDMAHHKLTHRMVLDPTA